MVIEIIFLAALIGYFLQSVLFVIGSSKSFPRNIDESLPDVSVIVAARNEEKNILNCLKSLNQLDYPEDKIQIILVDDRSTDNTGNLIDNFILDKPKFTKICTKKEIGRLKGKTNALANALEIASGEIILTTDADCVMTPSWVKSTVSYYSKDVAMVNGFTTQTASSNFTGMQAIDFIYLLIVAAGTINLGTPISCIGNNMSYRKKAYLEVGGYENLPFSVTEDFNLLKAIHRLKKYKIIYPLDRGALVTSVACDSLRSLYHQKKRWAVGGLKAVWQGYVIFIFGYITNLFLLLTPIFFSKVWLYLILFKLFIDFFMLFPAYKKFGLSKDLKYFITFEIYISVYVTLLPIMVFFTGKKVKWKGRKY
ncbi:MAG: glycosyltransferase [Ignavibacteriaceae bacterium]|nr:glycosyltransferase [Ignavibacteriaceae bacterium]